MQTEKDQANMKNIHRILLAVFVLSLVPVSSAKLLQKRNNSRLLHARNASKRQENRRHGIKRQENRRHERNASRKKPAKKLQSGNKPIGNRRHGIKQQENKRNARNANRKKLSSRNGLLSASIMRVWQRLKTAMENMAM